MATQPDTSDAPIAEADRPSKAKRITSRVVITLVVLWFLILNAFPVAELFLMWLPGETLAEMFAEGDTFELIHRTHFMTIGVTGWALVLSMVVQLRKPERRVAPLLLVIGAAVAGTILFGLSGTLSEWLEEEVVFVAIPVALLVAVHPARDDLLTRPSFDRPLGGMAVLAAVPWLAYILDNAWSQFQNVSTDPHAEPEHWAMASLMATIITLAAVIGSSDKPGWRLPAWIAVGGTVIFGVHSLVFSGLASALPGYWAVLAILWGIGYGVMIIRRSRGGTTTTAVT